MKNPHVSLIVATLCFLGFITSIPSSLSEKTDETISPKTSGYPVTLAVLRQISRSGIFEDDFFFSHRVAHISTRFGLDPKTYAEDNPSRGIWQLSQSQLLETQSNPSLAEFRIKIAQFFPQVGNWNFVTWDDLLNPLFNGLAFRLYSESLVVHLVDQFLPSLLLDQAQFYKTEFNSSSESDVFISDTLLFESVPKCSTEMDIVFVQDSSCTVYPLNFTDTLNYFVSVVDSLSFDGIRVGHVVYSSEVLPNFALDNGFSQVELRTRILGAGRPPGQYTLTASGITAALKMFDSAPQRPNGIPQVLITFTDGQAVEQLDEVTNKTKLAGINSFAIGIAYSWSQEQLLKISHNEPGRIMKNGYSFNLKEEFLYRSLMEICSVATTPELFTVSSGFLELGQTRNYRYAFPVLGNGLNVTVTGNVGGVRVFYSLDEVTPSSAINDGEIFMDEVTLIPKVEGFDYVYVAIEALDVVSLYEILVTQ